MNADLGRFGGLIKMWLTSNADFQSLSAQGLQRKLENTLTDVRALQKKIANCFSTDTTWAVREIAATQALNTRAKSDRTYHLLVSLRAGENPDAISCA